MQYIYPDDQPVNSHLSNEVPFQETADNEAFISQLDGFGTLSSWDSHFSFLDEEAFLNSLIHSNYA